MAYSVTEIVALKTADLTDLTEGEILIAVEEVNEYIRGYCNIRVVPKELRFTVARMATDLLRYDYAMIHGRPAASGGDTEFTPGEAQSINIGDTSVTFSKGGTSSVKHDKALSSHAAALDEIILNYRDILKEFRRIDWGV